MSRSYRKTPVIWYTHCRSERLDKHIWHKRWRSRERIKLASLDPENIDNHCTTDRREVSNPWNMGKDGKLYFNYGEEMNFIKKTANERGRSPQERSALKKRLLYKLMGK